MSEYLSKEEIKQWRSSLEKITLEEFAARLGKKIEQDKPTNDLIDIVFHGHPTVSADTDWNSTRSERLSAIAERSFEREKEISITPFSASKLKLEIADSPQENSNKTNSDNIEPEKKTVVNETPKKTNSTKKPAKKVSNKKVKETLNKVAEKLNKKASSKEKSEPVDSLREEVRVVFKKALTDREQKVYDHFAANQDKIVYAKDLAVLLELPRDYVYKYIKNLRAKIEGDKLRNAEKGGFILSLK